MRGDEGSRECADSHSAVADAQHGEDAVLQAIQDALRGD